MADPRELLVPSNAGMRLIALTTLFNKGDFGRLRTYIQDNYAPSLLESAPVAAHLAELKAMYRIAGKLRVGQVIAVDKHAALVVMQSERGAFYAAQVVVEEDYPHKITQYVHQEVEEESEEDMNNDHA